jgi:uncharacterized protein YycO
MKIYLYNFWKSFLTWFGDLYFAVEPPRCKAKHIEGMLETIQAGDIICRGYLYYADSYFIPNEFTHSGIVLNKREMIHSIAEGVQSIHPIDFVKDTDRFAILRPPYEENMKYFAVSKAIWHCDHNKTQYDFLFRDKDQNFYCHELTADCLAIAQIKVEKTKQSFGVWPFKFEKEVYLAQNLIDVCQIVYEFNP